MCIEEKLDWLGVGNAQSSHARKQAKRNRSAIKNFCIWSEEDVSKVTINPFYLAISVMKNNAVQILKIIIAKL